MNKLMKRIEYMLEYENDDFFININLKDEVSDKLYTYQLLHLFNLMTSLKSNNSVALDGSDTGTGKTHVAAALCKQINRRPFVVCPKIMISKWEEVLNYHEVVGLAVTNYESVKSGKNKYVKFNAEKDLYTWSLPKNAIVVFDEVHLCKNKNSQNGKLLLSVKDKATVLMLSATVADTPSSFNVVGYMLGFYNRLSQAKNWINGVLKEDQNYIGDTVKQSALCRQIYPARGSRVTIDELGDSFPKNQVTADCYTLDKEVEKEVNKAFNSIDHNTLVLKGVQDTDNKLKQMILADIMCARQKIEQYKIPVIKQLVEEYRSNGYSVVIFVNFIKTVKALSKILKTECLIYGELDADTVNKNVTEFQENRQRIIICTSAKALGVSLHDLYGVPRMSIINPVLSGISYKQILGRIYRVGSKTPSLQRMIYCANTCEQVFCKQMREKLKFLDKLNV